MGSRIWRIVGAAFVGMLGFGAVIPMLPVYLHEQAGASTFVTGLLIGLSSAFALLGRLFAGKTADREGPAHRSSVRDGLLCGIAGVLYLPVFGLWRHGGRTRVCMGWGRLLRHRGGGLGSRHCAATTGARRRSAFFRPGFGAAYPSDRPSGRRSGSIGAVALFLTVSSVAVMAIVLVMNEEPRPHHHTPSRWFPPPVLLPGIMLGLGNVTYAAMAGFLILLLHHRGHGTSWAFSAFAVAVLFGRVVFGGLPDRMGPRRSLFAGYACLAVGLTAIVAGHSSMLDLPAALLVGLGYAFPWPALASVVVGQVPVSERAAALGALNAFYDLFVAGSSAIGGAAAEHWGFTAPFWMALACVGGAAAMVLITGIGTNPQAITQQSCDDMAGACP